LLFLAYSYFTGRSYLRLSSLFSVWFPCILKSLEFFSKISSTWKVLESEFGSRKSCNLVVVPS